MCVHVRSQSSCRASSCRSGAGKRTASSSAAFLASPALRANMGSSSRSRLNLKPSVLTERSRWMASVGIRSSGLVSPQHPECSQTHGQTQAGGNAHMWLSLSLYLSLAVPLSVFLCVRTHPSGRGARPRCRRWHAPSHAQPSSGHGRTTCACDRRPPPHQQSLVHRQGPRHTDTQGRPLGRRAHTHQMPPPYSSTPSCRYPWLSFLALGLTYVTHVQTHR
jgi:hypothetical protein